MEVLIETNNLSVYMGSRTNPIQILDSVKFTVRAKAITGLIGPSGSGKTTLIRAVIGLLPQVHGQIDMDRSIVRSNIGYMPQDIALIGFFSARDMLIFSGNVYGMSKVEIEQRIEELRERLNLPDDLSKRIRTMSCGEQHRLSLAMALFHRPKIIFLDEPTVGSDPITSWKIWEYLRECRDKYGQTVVLTTHYLEEVRKADFVSVMKEGQLIHENSVSGMLAEMQTETIELAVTKIYRAHRQPISNGHITSSEQSDGKQSFVHRPSSIHKIPETRSHYHLIRASLLRMISKAYFPVFLLFCFGLSCIIAATIFILSKYLWKAPESSICIVDRDQSAISKTLIDSLHASWFHPEICSSLEEAHRLVEKKEKIGYLHIANDFESSIRPFQSIGLEEVRLQKLRFYGDFSNLFAIEFCRRWMDSRVAKVIKDYRRSKNFSQPLYDIVQIKFFDDEQKSLKFDDQDVSGVFIPICLLFLGFQYANGQSSLRIGFERKYSFHERQQSMGVTWGHQVISYLIRDLFSTSIIYVFTVFVLLLCLGMEFNMHLLCYLGIVYLVVAISICTGLFFASIIDNLTQAIAILFAINLTVLWFSGCFWSQKSLPYFMSPMNILVPYNSVIDVAVSFFNNGTPTFNSFECFGPLLGWAFFYLVAAIRWL